MRDFKFTECMELLDKLLQREFDGDVLLRRILRYYQHQEFAIERTQFLLDKMPLRAELLQTMSAGISKARHLEINRKGLAESELTPIETFLVCVAEVSFVTEAYYTVAFRCGELIASLGNGLSRFKPWGVCRVRNHLLEHPLDNREWNEENHVQLISKENGMTLFKGHCGLYSDVEEFNFTLLEKLGPLLAARSGTT